MPANADAVSCVDAPKRDMEMGRNRQRGKNKVRQTDRRTDGQTDRQTEGRN
jgi:hypothetical protein